MEQTNENNSLACETLIGIFTVDSGVVKVLLSRKKTEPYKGYWTLIGKKLQIDETLEDNITDVVIDETGLSNIYIEQIHTFSSLDRNYSERTLSTVFIGLVDSKTVELKQYKENNGDFSWFSIDAIPKMGYDHDILLKYAIDYLRKKITNSNILKLLFPSDFTLPELQKVYEQILNITIDRRNFRKKFVSMNLIEDTGYKNEGFTGRPAKLYRFQDELKEKTLF